MVSGALVGGILGLTLQLYSNGVRKLPLMRHPWEHVLLTGQFNTPHAMQMMHAVALPKPIHLPPNHVSYFHVAGHAHIVPENMLSRQPSIQVIGTAL